MSFGLEYQHQYEENDDKYQKEDALPSACIPLIPISKIQGEDQLRNRSTVNDIMSVYALCRHIQLFHCFRHLYRGLLNIVLHAVEECALINDQDRQIFEQFGQLCDGFSNLGQLSISSMQIHIGRK